MAASPVYIFFSRWVQSPYRTPPNLFKAMTTQTPARLQVDPETIDDSEKPPQTGQIFNIWFLKWAGGDSTNRNIKAKFRVDIDRDSGYTKATKPPICLFFARGACYKGKNCQFLHRVPLESDYFLQTQDCFGRDKTMHHKDDMNGVGSYLKPNRTLYIGNLFVNKDITTQLNKTFGQFGDIEKVRVINAKKCCFLTYKFEFQAQFAKEAMQSQSLSDNYNEILFIRWANDDPNSNSREDEKRRLEEITINTIKNLLDDAGPDFKKIKKAPVDETSQEIEEYAITEPVEEPQPTKLAFNLSTLDTLKKIRQKEKDTPIVKNPKSALSSLVQYESSEEED